MRFFLTKIARYNIDPIFIKIKINQNILNFSNFKMIYKFLKFLAKRKVLAYYHTH